MKNNITELVFILDRSGSMAGMEKDTVGGFNSMLQRQKECEGTAFVTTVLFNNDSITIHDRKPIEEVAPLTERDFRVGGCTALLDAVGSTIEHIRSIHRYIRPEDVPEHTILAITTDGYENASRRYSSAAVKKLVREQEEAGWEVLYLAANIDAVETGASFGIRAENAVQYHLDTKGSDNAFKAVCEAACSLRKTGAKGKAWRESADRDFESRK